MSPTYGIIEESALKPSPGYKPQAVNFSGPNGTNGECGIMLPSLTSTDTGKLSWAGWFRPVTWANRNSYFTCDPNGLFDPSWFGITGGTNLVRGEVASPTDVWGMSSAFSNFTPHDNLWAHVMYTFDVARSGTPHRTGSIALFGVDVTTNRDADSTVMDLVLHGKEFWFGDDGFGDSSEQMDVADFSFWPDVSWLTSGGTLDPTVYPNFVSNGKPVNPTQTILALGRPAVMLTGGVSGFLANAMGTAGPLIVPTKFADGTSATYDSPTNSSSFPP